MYTYTLDQSQAVFVDDAWCILLVVSVHQRALVVSLTTGQTSIGRGGVAPTLGGRLGAKDKNNNAEIDFPQIS